MRVEPTSCAALIDAPGFAEVAAEYIAQKIEGLPDPAGRFEHYQALEEAGMLHVFGAFDGRRVTGFITVLATMVPHYATPLICTESFFVAKADRASGAGLALLKAAEDKARELGAGGFLVSAPAEGGLAKILLHYGYRDANRVFFKRFFDA